MEASLSTTYNAQAIVNACRRPRERLLLLSSPMLTLLYWMGQWVKINSKGAFLILMFMLHFCLYKILINQNLSTISSLIYLFCTSCETEITKGQLISKCLFEKIIWTKIPTKNLIDSAHYTCWAESIKFFVGILVQMIFSKRHFEIN